MSTALPRLSLAIALCCSYGCWAEAVTQQAFTFRVGAVLEDGETLCSGTRSAEMITSIVHVSLAAPASRPEQASSFNTGL